MRRVRRPPAAVTGLREARAIAANLGRDARATRRRRKLTQSQVGAMVDLGQSEVSYLERGHGARTSIETWVAIGIALERPMAIGFSRDVVEPLIDAGHLAAQELLIRLATEAGWRASFEVRAESGAFGISTDVVLAGHETVVLAEIWNRIDDLGAGVRSTDRKLVAAPPDARSVWLLVDTAANRRIVRRFPAVLRARFRGSSAGWVRALVVGGPPPAEPGLVWVDVRTHRIRAVRFLARPH
jgi:transcriptional regulator with XRE-family HTH domain